MGRSCDVILYLSGDSIFDLYKTKQDRKDQYLERRDEQVK